MNLYIRQDRSGKSSTKSDEQLFLDFQRGGDVDGLGELFRRYTHLVLGVCMKYLRDEEAAKDAVMQIFEKMLDKPGDTEIQNFKSWLFTVSRNFCLMELRHRQAGMRAKEQKLIELQSELMESYTEMHHYDEEETEGSREKIMMAMKKLNDEQRRCLQLFYLEEKSYKEVIEITGYDFKQVKSFIQNGKRNLKILLDHGSR